MLDLSKSTLIRISIGTLFALVVFSITSSWVVSQQYSEFNAMQMKLDELDLNIKRLECEARRNEIALTDLFTDLIKASESGPIGHGTINAFKAHKQRFEGTGCSS